MAVLVEYGSHEDRNKKHRRKMEDAVVLEHSLMIDEQPAGVSFIAVYDGHSGRGAADFCSQNLHKILLKCCPSLGDAPPKDVITALSKSFVNTNEELSQCTSVPKHAGCTAVACVARPSQLFVANVGDARAVLCRSLSSGSVVLRLSEDHKASVASEAERVTKAGAFIKDDRVNGQIEITRSIGDQLLKKYLLPDPFVSFTELGAVPPDSRGHCLIVACDGVWDVFSDQEAVDFVLADERRGMSCNELAKALVAEALVRESTDNLSAVVCFIK